MSDTILGGINFGNIDNHIPTLDINFIEDNIPKYIPVKFIESDKSNNSIKFLKLLELINNNEIDTTDLKIKDSANKIWTWDSMHEAFIDKTDTEKWGSCFYMLDEYTELELLNLEVQILPKQVKNTKIKLDKDKAKKLVLHDLELTYIELSLKLDYYKTDEDKRDYIYELLKVYSVLIQFLRRRYTR